MKKYRRKKPHVFRAIQWTGKNPKTLRSFIGRQGRVLSLEMDMASVSAPGWWFLAALGDWFVKNEDNRLDFYHDEDFRREFEPV